MKIADIEAISLVWPPAEKDFWTSLRPVSYGTELIVRVHTDDGQVGIGEAHGYRQSPAIFKRHADGSVEADGAAKLVTELLKPLLVGEDPRHTEHLWDKMFRLTHKRGPYQRIAGIMGSSNHQIMTAIAGIDIALWDLKGKAAGQPVYKLLGGTRDRVPTYVTGGYYHDDKTTADLVAECREYVGMGYKAMKLKIGGVSVEEDTDRVGAVRQALGPDVDIMVDGNEGYDVPTAIRMAHAMEPLGVRWIEEPVHWYDPVEALARVAAATSIPMASGENALHRWDARDLILRGGIRIMQFDSTRFGGITELLKIAALCAAHNVRLAPHHDPQIHAHVVAAVPVGEIVESFPTEKRDPMWATLFTRRPEIKGGELILRDDPGWGLDLNEETLKKHGVWA